MTITGIEVEKFQSHDHTIIEPSDKVTVIKGTSHGGKSSLVRAVRWAIENKPMGFDFKSWFSDDKEETRVSMEFSDFTHFSKVRSDKLNQYDTCTSSKPFKALRADVPEAVSAITQMNEVNIQQQLDPYFMLQSSPGEVGRMFNEAVGLEIIDEAISEAKKAFNTVNAQRVACYDQVEKLNEELLEYEGLHEIEELVDEIEEKGRALDFLHSNRTKIIAYMEEMEVLEGDILITKEFLKLEELHMELSVQATYLKQLKAKRMQLWEAVLEYSTTQARIAVNKKWLEAEELFIEIWKIAENVSKLKSERVQLKRTLRHINQTKDAIQAKTDALAITRKQIRKLLQQTKLCPFCYSEIDQETIDHICRRKGI